MPIKTYNTKADFDADYRIGAEPQGHPNNRAEVKLNYHRAVMLPICQDRAARLIAAMNWTAPGPAIVLVGAGFSWTAEAMEALGFTRVVGIDVSPYVQSAKNTSEASEYDAAILAVGLNPLSGEGAAIKASLVSRAGGSGNRVRASRSVLNQDGSTNNSRNAVRSALGLSGNQQPDWLVSEDVIVNLSDSEFTTLSTRLRNWVPNVAHIVTIPYGVFPSDGFNWKTLADWKALAPNDVFINIGTFEVL